MSIMGKREAFFLSILAQDAVKTRSRDSWQTDTKSMKPWVSPSLSIETKLSGKTFQENPGIQRAWETPPHLHISPHIGGWEACRQSRPQKKAAVTTGLPGSACSSRSPRSRQAPGLEHLVSHESFDGVNSGSFHFVLCQSNAFSETHLENCQAPLLWSPGMAFLSDSRHEQRFTDKTVAIALKCTLPKQLLQTKQDIMGRVKWHQMPMLSGSWMKTRLAGQLLGPHWRDLLWLQIAASTMNSLAGHTKINLCFLISNWIALI